MKVKVSFFKPNGKWYTDEEVEWIKGDQHLYGHGIYGEYRNSLYNHLNGRLNGMWAICHEPDHEYSHPLMVKVDHANT